MIINPFVGSIILISVQKFVPEIFIVKINVITVVVRTIIIVIGLCFSLCFSKQISEKFLFKVCFGDSIFIKVDLIFADRCIFICSVVYRFKDNGFKTAALYCDRNGFCISDIVDLFRSDYLSVVIAVECYRTAVDIARYLKCDNRFFFGNNTCTYRKNNS